jgi:hypothetical protein
MATYAKSFIDNGQIKIVNRDGVDFEQAIQERASSLFKIKFLFRFFIALMIGFGLTSFSPLFFNFISGWQIAFFVALTIGSLVMAGNYSDTITAKKKKLSARWLLNIIWQKKNFKLKSWSCKRNSLNIIQTCNRLRHKPNSALKSRRK